jgi:hypothetical protein
MARRAPAPSQASDSQVMLGLLLGATSAGGARVIGLECRSPQRAGGWPRDHAKLSPDRALAWIGTGSVVSRLCHYPTARRPQSQPPMGRIAMSSGAGSIAKPQYRDRPARGNSDSQTNRGSWR